MSQLSRRSYVGPTHEKRLSRHRVTDEDLLEYVLRVAVLCPATSPKVPPVSTVQPKPTESKEKEYHHKFSDTISLKFGSIHDILPTSSKTVKLPSKFWVALEQKLKTITGDKDPSDLTHMCFSAFYATYQSEKSHPSTVEALILNFARDARRVLANVPSSDSHALNSQIAQFASMLRSLTPLPPELATRLDNYSLGFQSPQNESGSAAPDRGDSATAAINISANIPDTVLTVAKLFPEVKAHREMDRLKKICTEKAAFIDLKTCLKNINAGEEFPGCRQQFQSDDAWNKWRMVETSQLSQLMLAMTSNNPELTKSLSSDDGLSYTHGVRHSVTHVDSPVITSRQTAALSFGSRRSVYGGVPGDGVSEFAMEDEDGEDITHAEHHFTFIPPNPRRFYKRLVERCLDADLESMHSPEVDDADEVPLTILSPPHVKLIKECALRWRIGQPYRSTCFLDLIKQLYERGDVPMDCVPEAQQAVDKVLRDTPIEMWSNQDSDLLTSSYGSVYNIFLSCLYHSMDSFPKIKASEIQQYLSILDNIRESGLIKQFEADMNNRLSQLEDKIREVSEQHYKGEMQNLQSNAGVNRALPLLLMTDSIEKAAKQLDKRFREPLVGRVELGALMVEIEVPLFVTDLEKAAEKLRISSMSGPNPDVPIQDIFSLYKRTKTMLSMYEAYHLENKIDFDFDKFFMQYVLWWLSQTDNKTGQWVQAAIAADKFQAENTEGHSSSIVDLFDSLRSASTFLRELEWSDEYQNARFLTSLSKTISKAVEQYCRSVEELFMTEMFPRPTEYLQAQKSSAWLEKAKQLANTSEKRVEPFNFRSESCVKLNNVEAARKLLDNLYNLIQVDRVTETLSTYPTVPEKVERPKFLFMVKIVMAENLVPLDSSPTSLLDTFVTLSDEAGNRLVKTRTIYETLNPRWEETFDISVEKALWLMCSIRDRALMGQHDVVGRSFICLNPSQYGDFLTHDVWLNLEPAPGRILLRLSMEGETDDAQFYFGRAFRSLKRSEGDMMRIFTDKMSPFIRQSLSRPVLKSMLKGGTMGLDYNKALANMTELYRSALGSHVSEVQVPLPSSERPRVRPDEMTDVEIERAIVPLFDYFDANLQVLNTHLSETAKEMVMNKVWKEILIIIEGLLIPPLSKQASDMSPMSDKEVDIVFKWLKFLRDYFHADGEGMSSEALQNQKYRDLLSIRLYYDWHTDTLMEECVRLMQQSLREAVPIKKRVKSMYNQRNLGTIKDRKKEKNQEKESSSGEIILRILRMRPNTHEFIAQQLDIMAAVRVEKERSETARTQRRAQRLRHGAAPESSPGPARGD